MQDWHSGGTVNLLSIATPLGPKWKICSAQNKLEGTQGPQLKGSPVAISLKNMDFVLKAMGSYWKLLGRGETGCNLSMVSRQLFTVSSLDICLSKYSPPSARIHVFFKTHLPCEILPGNTHPLFSSLQPLTFFLLCHLCSCPFSPNVSILQVSFCTQVFINYSRYRVTVTIGDRYCT